MSAVETVDVSPDEAGMRLDRWFRTRYPDLKHGQLQKLLRSGQIRVDGGRAKANLRLEEGQSVRVPPLKVERPVSGKAATAITKDDIRFVQGLVIHKDGHVLALNKPPGLAVQGGSKTERHVDGLLDGLKFKASERPRLVHRLDKDTSGVLLLARDRRAAAALGDALKGREAVKTYWALVEGVPAPARGEISLPLAKRGKPGSERVRVCEEGDSDAQRAVTRYAVLESAGRKLSWVALWPVTGRTHQLRVHMAAVGHPIVGDGKYGSSDPVSGGEIDNLLHLHAREIDIPNPSGGRLHVTAPLPEHMLKTWKLLGFEPDRSMAEFEEVV
ncbi:MAG: RluA family pseudouridine synthase [Hyphomicrobiaceae bacterium]|nr:RluA family pseudouridine synthase [Hyphomicrobiaceae bacterium]